jgi:tRNA(fMet)-specific endonuclease VapC
MLDTNTLSELIRSPRGALTERLAAIEPDEVCTSIVVACELRFGARRKGSDVLTRRVEQLLGTLNVLPLDPPADEHYADIRAALEQLGTPIGSHDLFIAAHARSRGLTLVTHNIREFTRVPDLNVEDWLAA